MDYVTRAEWGARPPEHTTPLYSPLGVAGHYNGPAVGIAGNDCGQTTCAETVRGTQNYHMNTKGWSDIAYNWLVCPSCGLIYEGRGWDTRSAANGTDSGNDDYHAVMVLIGGNEPLTGAAESSVARLLNVHRERYGTDRLRPHSSFKATDCPGDSFRRAINDGLDYNGEDDELTEEQMQRLKDLITERTDAKVEEAIERIVADLQRGRVFARDLQYLRRDVRAIAHDAGLETAHEPPDVVRS